MQSLRVLSSFLQSFRVSFTIFPGSFYIFTCTVTRNVNTSRNIYRYNIIEFTLYMYVFMYGLAKNANTTKDPCLIPRDPRKTTPPAVDPRRKRRHHRHSQSVSNYFVVVVYNSSMIVLDRRILSMF